MKVLNDSLQKGQTKNLKTQLKNAIDIIRQEWFQVSSQVTADPFNVEDYLDSFEDVSFNLLQYVVNMVDVSVSTFDRTSFKCCLLIHGNISRCIFRFYCVLSAQTLSLCFIILMFNAVLRVSSKMFNHLLLHRSFSTFTLCGSIITLFFRATLQCTMQFHTEISMLFQFFWTLKFVISTNRIRLVTRVLCWSHWQKRDRQLTRM